MYSLHASFRANGAFFPDDNRSSYLLQHKHNYTEPSMLNASIQDMNAAAPVHDRKLDVDGMEGPPGRYVGDNPDMSDPVNIQWYEMQDIPPEDIRWGALLPIHENAVPLIKTSNDDINQQKSSFEAVAEEVKEDEEDEEGKEPSFPSRPIVPIVSLGFAGQLVFVNPKHTAYLSHKSSSSNVPNMHHSDKHVSEFNDSGGEGFGWRDDDDDITPGDSISCQVSENSSAVNVRESEPIANPDFVGDTAASLQTCAKQILDDESNGCTIIIYALHSFLTDIEHKNISLPEETASNSQVNDDLNVSSEVQFCDFKFGSSRDENLQATTISTMTSMQLANSDEGGNDRQFMRNSLEQNSPVDDSCTFLCADYHLFSQANVAPCLLSPQSFGTANVSHLMEAMASWLESIGYNHSHVLLCRFLAICCRYGLPQVPTEDGFLNVGSGLLEQLSKILESKSNLDINEQITQKDTFVNVSESVPDKAKARSLLEMQHLLFVGHREAACDAAIAGGLYEHALILAWSIGPQMHQRVMTRFDMLCFSLYKFATLEGH